MTGLFADWLVQILDEFWERPTIGINNDLGYGNFLGGGFPLGVGYGNFLGGSFPLGFGFGY